MRASPARRDGLLSGCLPGQAATATPKRINLGMGVSRWAMPSGRGKPSKFEEREVSSVEMGCREMAMAHEMQRRNVSM